MKKTVYIEGMMCPHCESRVKAALEAVRGVKKAAVSYKKGSAVVTPDGAVEDDALRAAVEAQGYKVTDLK